MENTLYNTVVKNSNLPYNTKEVVRLIILIKKSKNEERIGNYKYQLFVKLSKNILKGVNNFFSICKKMEVNEDKLMHENEDVVNECYLVLENCLKNVNLKYVKNFYFYFNNALNKAMFRLYKKYYQKHQDVIVNTDENEKYQMNTISQKQHIDCTDIDLASFSQLERDIVEHKMVNGKLKDFLKEHKLPATQYYTLWEGIQKKIFEIYKNPLTNKIEY